jgi:hypothetical protein
MKGLLKLLLVVVLGLGVYVVLVKAGQMPAVRHQVQEAIQGFRDGVRATRG